MFEHSCGYRAEVQLEVCPRDGRIDGAWTEVEVAAEPAPEPEPEPAPPPEPEPVAEPAPSAEAPPEPDGGGWACTRCGRVNAASHGACVECGADAPASGVQVTGDAGTFVLLPGCDLLLGRVAASPAAAALRRFGNISREHARLSRPVEGPITVTDLRSSNRTWIVEPGGPRPLPAMVAVPLAGTTVLQLGNRPDGANARITIGGPA
jgi:hypothetical protein